jgi:hypothetical protein
MKSAASWGSHWGRVASCYEQIIQYEKTKGAPFNHLILTRPDALVMSPIDPANVLTSDSIIYKRFAEAEEYMPCLTETYRVHDHLLSMPRHLGDVIFRNVDEGAVCSDKFRIMFCLDVSEAPLGWRIRRLGVKAHAVDLPITLVRSDHIECHRINKGAFPLEFGECLVMSALRMRQQRRPRNIRMCSNNNKVMGEKNGFITGDFLPPDAKLWNCEPRHRNVLQGEMSAGVVYISNFMTSDEISMLQEFESKQNYRSSVTSTSSQMYVRVHKAKRGFPPLLRSINDRILSLFRNSSELHNPALQFTSYNPGRAGINQVHHDRNIHPDRYVTVLVYVTAPNRGGHTIFPLVNRGGRRKLHVSFGPHAGSMENPRMVYMDGPEYAHAKVMCHNARMEDIHGREYSGFSVAVVPGDAVVFWQWGLNESGIDSPEWGHYHGACNIVGAGNHSKLAMQAFIEKPGITSAVHERLCQCTGSCEYDKSNSALTCSS